MIKEFVPAVEWLEQNYHKDVSNQYGNWRLLVDHVTKTWANTRKAAYSRPDQGYPGDVYMAEMFSVKADASCQTYDADLGEDGYRDICRCTGDARMPCHIEWTEEREKGWLETGRDGIEVMFEDLDFMQNYDQNISRPNTLIT